MASLKKLQLNLQGKDFRGHPGMEEKILLSSERNCLVTKV